MTAGRFTPAYDETLREMHAAGRPCKETGLPISAEVPSHG